MTIGDAMKPLRVYIDTSVFGGCFDSEFADMSNAFLEMVVRGGINALISDTLAGELVDAPQEVRDILQRVIDSGCERLTLTREAEELRDSYLAAGVVTGKYENDALHVACATIARADVIVSWNFKHLVNPFRVRAFNGVNVAQGYGQVIVMTPADIVEFMEGNDEEEKNI